MNSSLYLLIGFIGLIMVVEVLNGLIDHSLNAYGLVPRTTSGLAGIPLSPFLHGSFLHVQSNAVGLLALGCLAVIRSRERFPWVCLVIILLGGLGVWLVGRPATHVGASGLVFGLFGYLLVKGLLDRSILSVLVAVVVAGVFGWVILSGILPANAYVSWEGHLVRVGGGGVGGHNRPRRTAITQGRKSAHGEVVQMESTQENPGTERPGPLAGIRVADFSVHAAGPFAGLMLAEMGAQVIKIESSARLDITRRPHAMYGKPPSSFEQINANKMSVCLNLKEPRAVELALELVSVSELALENFRPGVLSRLGLGYEAMREVRPDIILVSLSSNGQTGPESNYAGYAPMFSALGGLGHLTGYADGPPVELRHAMDHTGGMLAAFAAVAALSARQGTGLGQHVDVSMRDLATSFIGPELLGCCHELP